MTRDPDHKPRRGRPPAGEVGMAEERVLDAAITEFLAELGEQPNDFKDRVMEGTRNGMDEMLKAAPDDLVLDLAVISASQTGIQYFYNAFAGQPDVATALGIKDQADRWAQMAQEWQAVEQRIDDVVPSALKKALAA